MQAICSISADTILGENNRYRVANGQPNATGERAAVAALAEWILSK